MSKVTIKRHTYYNNNVIYFKLIPEGISCEKVFNQLVDFGYCCAKFDNLDQVFSDYIEPVIAANKPWEDIYDLVNSILNTEWLLSDFFNSDGLGEFWRDLRDVGKSDEQIWEFISPTIESYLGSIYVNSCPKTNEEKLICELKQMVDVVVS